MKISVDGGALCAPKHAQYGTTRFTIDFLKALSIYSHDNVYTVYTYCDLDNLHTYSSLNFRCIRPRTGWMSVQVMREELLNPKDVFLGINQALPLYTPAQKVVISHGLSFFNYPELYPKDYSRLLKQMKTYLSRADDIIVSSKRVYDQIIQLKPTGRVHTIPFGLPFSYSSIPIVPDFAKQKWSTVGNAGSDVRKEHRMRYKSKKSNGIRPQTQENINPEQRIDTETRFFLYVGSNQAIKNVSFLVDAFLQFSQQKQFSDMQLILIGVANLEINHERIRCIPHLPSDEIKWFYQNATAYCTASLYESFNWPVLEALSQKCPVVALESAITPEQKPFVTNVQNKTDFISAMRDLAYSNYNFTDINKIEQTFSWKRFVKRLNEVYN